MTNVWVRHGGYFSVAQTRSEVLEARTRALTGGQFVHLDVVHPGTPGKASIDPHAITAVYEQTEPAGRGDVMSIHDVPAYLKSRGIRVELQRVDPPPDPSGDNERLPDAYTPTPGSD